jgi:hypothetical protein
MGKQESKRGDLGEPVLSWIPYNISEEEARYRVQEAADQNAEHLDPKSAEFDVRVQETLQGILADLDYLSFEWETLCEDLTVLMNDVNPNSDEWFAEVSNFGWQQMDGTKSFSATTGEELLREILPETDCHFKIYHPPEENQIVINNAHHDSPVWNEFYCIHPASECERCGKSLPLSKLVDHPEGCGKLCDDCFQACQKEK